MITFGNAYLVEAREIEAIAKENSGNAAYPYRLTVETKSHSKYSVDFANKDIRDREAERIAYEVERIHLNYDITVDVIHDVIAKEVEKIRPFLKRIEKAVIPAEPKGEQHEG